MFLVLLLVSFIILSKSLSSYFRLFNHVPSIVIGGMYHSCLENFYQLSGYSIILLVMVVVPSIIPA